MPDPNEMAKRLAGLEEEYDDFMARVKNLGYHSIEEYRPNNSDEEFMKKHYFAVRSEIDDLRRRYIAELTRSLEASSRSLEQATAKLKESTDALGKTSEEQLAVIKGVRKSSDRLNFVTDCLLILTGVLAVAGTGSYTLELAIQNGWTGEKATWLTTGIVLVVVVVIFLAFNEVRKRHESDRS